MEYHSFYGGRRGASFVIKKSYPDIPSMIQDFDQGYSFTDVSFEEYVIIDNPYRVHKDNGKIFRRGYNFDNDTRSILCTVARDGEEGSIVFNQSKAFYCGDTVYYHQENYSSTKGGLGGAEYVGQIQGPPGPAPDVKIDTISNVREQQIRKAQEGNHIELETATDALVPGKDEDTYNDDIQIRWMNDFVDNSYEKNDLLLGFQIPYLVNDFTSEQVSPYDSADVDPVTASDGENHPFYKAWKIKIPQGYHGDDLKNLRVTTFTEEAEKNNPIFYIWENPQTEAKEVTQIKLGQETKTDKKDEDLYIDDQILVYDVYKWSVPEAADTSEGIFEKTWYIGKYKQIENFSVEDDKLKISFTADKSVYIKSKIDTTDGTKDGTGRTISEQDQPLNIEGTGSQKVQIDFINENGTTTTTEPAGAPLNYLMELQLTSDKHLIALYSDPSRRQQLINNEKKEGYAKAYSSAGSTSIQRGMLDFFSPAKGLQWYTGWQDLGTLGIGQGVLIGGRLTKQDFANHGYPDVDLSDVDAVAEILNLIYDSGYYIPQGQQDSEENRSLYQYKILTVSHDNDDGTSSQNFYAYSYIKEAADDSYRGWYYLGTLLNDTASTVLLINQNDENYVTRSTQLNKQGLWFVIKKQYNIQYDFADSEIICDNPLSTITEGKSYKTRFSGSNIDLTQSYMESSTGNIDISKSPYYNSTSKILTIPQVTGDIYIHAIVSTRSSLSITNQINSGE